MGKKTTNTSRRGPTTTCKKIIFAFVRENAERMMHSIRWHKVGMTEEETLTILDHINEYMKRISKDGGSVRDI